MIDAKFENERLLQEFAAFRRARLKRQQRLLNLIILSERLLTCSRPKKEGPGLSA